MAYADMLQRALRWYPLVLLAGCEIPCPPAQFAEGEIVRLRIQPEQRVMVLHHGICLPGESRPYAVRFPNGRQEGIREFELAKEQ